LKNLFRATAFRWSVSIAGGSTAIALVLFGFIYWQTAVHERQRIDGLIMREAAYISGQPPDEAAANLKTWIDEDPHAVRYAGIFAKDGRHLAGNLLDQPSRLTEDGRAHGVVFKRIDRDHDGDEPEAVRAVAIRLSDNHLLVLGYDIDELEDVQTIIFRALALGLLPAIALSLLGGYLLARRAQNRVASIHEVLGRVMQGHLGERLPVKGSGDEMDRLTEAVNRTLEEIEHLVGEIHGIGDNIAHDLRTPLTRVRARLELGREEARTYEELQVCVDHAIRSVDGALSVVTAVLRIGEIERGRRKAEFGLVDLADVASRAFELYEPLAEDMEVSLRLVVGAGFVVIGDRDLLLEAVNNLLDNALKFAPVRTEITLSLITDGETASLSVRDHGPGIPLAERERVLQRFYRGEKSRTAQGSGLGLNIVAAIVSLHDFGFDIGDAAPGCKVTIRCRYLRGNMPPPIQVQDDCPPERPIPVRPAFAPVAMPIYQGTTSAL
jgi:signal transduction histidine kinase